MQCTIKHLFQCIFFLVIGNYFLAPPASLGTVYRRTVYIGMRHILAIVPFIVLLAVWSLNCTNIHSITFNNYCILQLLQSICLFNGILAKQRWGQNVAQSVAWLATNNVNGGYLILEIEVLCHTIKDNHHSQSWDHFFMKRDALSL